MYILKYTYPTHKCTFIVTCLLIFIHDKRTYKLKCKKIRLVVEVYIYIFEKNS